MLIVNYSHIGLRLIKKTQRRKEENGKQHQVYLKMGISIVGSLNYDLVTYAESIPGPGETICANDFQTHTGGKGLNQAIAIAKLKRPDSTYGVRMIGTVGNDSFGSELIRILEEHHVDVSQVNIHPTMRTGVATILVEKKTGQNRILITAGANGQSVYTDDQLEAIFPRDLKDNNKVRHMVVFQQEIPDPCSIMRWLKRERKNFDIVFNPSPFKNIRMDDWNLIDILVVNEVESLQIVESVLDEVSVKKIKKEIQENFVKGYKRICELLQRKCVSSEGPSIVIITLGAEGVLFSSKKQPEVKFREPIRNIKVIDTTGAGDTFLGAFITQYYQGNDITKAIEFSTKASSLTIQKPGASESIATYDEVIQIS